MLLDEAAYPLVAFAPLRTALTKKQCELVIICGKFFSRELLV
jgi:hypothetical protein